MGCHVNAIGQKRHGAVGKARTDFHHHEQRSDQGRQLGARFRTIMSVAQKDMVAGPDAVAVRAMIPGMDMIVCHGAIVPSKALKTKLFSRHHRLLNRTGREVRLGGVFAEGLSMRARFSAWVLPLLFCTPLLANSAFAAPGDIFKDPSPLPFLQLHDTLSMQW